MKSIERIGSPQRPPSRQGQAAVRRAGEIEIAPDGTQRRGTSGQAPANHQGTRPAAGFLAQYVDQNFPWGRAPLRKEARRQRATRAYIVADMLPDLLAETLRLRTVDETL